MRNLEIFVAPTEFKFVGESQPGVFEGYGSVYDILDSHKDVIVKGAYDTTLAEHAVKGTMPGMYVEHSAYTGGDPLPVGVWTEVKSDDRGLRVKGKISALDTDHGRRIAGLMKDGALSGLSIAYAVPAGGARMGKKQGEPRRTLTELKLHSVDIVRDPSNSAARIQEIKSAFRMHLKDAPDGDGNDPNEDPFEADVEAAITALCAAMDMHDKSMANGMGTMSSYNSSKHDAVLMSHMQDAHQALTGDRVPAGMTGYSKSGMTIREIEKKLRDEFDLSRARASEVAVRLFGSLPRDEGSNQATHVSKKAALDELSLNLADFSLPKF
jgi:HK97 family phage prohead protease